MKLSTVFSFLILTGFATHVHARAVCEVQHGTNFYEDNAVRVSNFGLADEVVNKKCAVTWKLVKSEIVTPGTAKLTEAPADPFAKIKADIKNQIDVRFQSGSANLSAAFENSLAELAEALKADRASRIVVSGHADNSGNPVANQKLSQQRAEAVKAFLVKNGISAEQISTQSFSSEVPVSDNSTEFGRALNRRTTVRVQ